MGKDAYELADRDHALAALMGITGSDFGVEPELLQGAADFGASGYGGYNGGPDFGDDWAQSYDMDFAQGSFDLSDQIAGEDVTFGGPSMFGADAVAHPQAQAIIAQHVQRTKHRNARALLLEPNKYSDLKVERYTFAVNTTITNLGTSGALSGSNSPDVNFRPQRVTANVVSPGMVLISDGRIANVSFTVGGTIDAWQWNANAVGEHLDVPTLTPANKATFVGSYSGLVPSPLTGTGAFTFMLSFTGPASIVA